MDLRQSFGCRPKRNIQRVTRTGNRVHRTNKEDIDPEDSVSNIGRSVADEDRDKDNRSSVDTELEVLDRDDKGNEQYFAIVKDIICSEKVDRAVIPERSDTMFGTSRVLSKREEAYLP